MSSNNNNNNNNTRKPSQRKYTAVPPNYNNNVSSSIFQFVREAEAYVRSGKVLCGRYLPLQHKVLGHGTFGVVLKCSDEQYHHHHQGSTTAAAATTSSFSLENNNNIDYSIVALKVTQPEPDHRKLAKLEIQNLDKLNRLEDRMKAKLENVDTTKLAMFLSPRSRALRKRKKPVVGRAYPNSPSQSSQSETNNKNKNNDDDESEITAIDDDPRLQNFVAQPLLRKKQLQLVSAISSSTSLNQKKKNKNRKQQQQQEEQDDTNDDEIDQLLGLWICNDDPTKFCQSFVKLLRYHEWGTSFVLVFEHLDVTLEHLNFQSFIKYRYQINQIENEIALIEQQEKKQQQQKLHNENSNDDDEDGDELLLQNAKDNFSLNNRNPNNNNNNIAGITGFISILPTVAAKLHFLRNVATALLKAIAKLQLIGLVHADLKPGNIMIVRNKNTERNQNNTTSNADDHNKDNANDHGLNSSPISNNNNHSSSPPQTPFQQSSNNNNNTSTSLQQQKSNLFNKLTSLEAEIVSQIPTEDEIRIIDFGSSVFFHERILPEYSQTRNYRAPETMLRLSPYSPTIDVWSIGVILAELALGYRLVRAYDEVNAIALIEAQIGQVPRDLIEMSRKRDVLYRQVTVASVVSIWEEEQEIMTEDEDEDDNNSSNRYQQQKSSHSSQDSDLVDSPEIIITTQPPSQLNSGNQTATNNIDTANSCDDQNNNNQCLVVPRSVVVKNIRRSKSKSSSPSQEDAAVTTSSATTSADVKTKNTNKEPRIIRRHQVNKIIEHKEWVPVAQNRTYTRPPLAVVLRRALTGKTTSSHQSSFFNTATNSSSNIHNNNDNNDDDNDQEKEEASSPSTGFLNTSEYKEQQENCTSPCDDDEDALQEEDDIENFIALVCRLLDCDPRTRITPQSALQQPFITRENVASPIADTNLSSLSPMMRERSIEDEENENEIDDSKKSVKGGGNTSDIKKKKNIFSMSENNSKSQQRKDSASNNRSASSCRSKSAVNRKLSVDAASCEQDDEEEDQDERTQLHRPEDNNKTELSRIKNQQEAHHHQDSSPATMLGPLKIEEQEWKADAAETTK